jgi:hypothetical protein
MAYNIDKQQLKKKNHPNNRLELNNSLVKGKKSENSGCSMSNYTSYSSSESTKLIKTANISFFIDYITIYPILLTVNKNFTIIILRREIKKVKKNTLIAVVTTSPTMPGSACHVPNPIEGILAPVFNSKNRIPSAIFKIPSKRVDCTLLI